MPEKQQQKAVRRKKKREISIFCIVLMGREVVLICHDLPAAASLTLVGQSLLPKEGVGMLLHCQGCRECRACGGCEGGASGERHFTLAGLLEDPAVPSIC